jgi:hypothetical protein
MAKAKNPNEVKRGLAAQEMFEEGVRKGKVPADDKTYSPEAAARTRQNMMVNEYNMSGDGKAKPYTAIRNKVVQSWGEIKGLGTKPGKKK